MKKILVPIDSSERHSYALDFSLKISAQIDNLEIILLHVVNPPIWASESQDIQGRMASFSQEMLETIQKNQLSGVKTTLLVKIGNTFKEIIKLCKELEPDMIVMDFCGRDQSDGLFMGSNTEKVVRSSETPVRG